MGIEKESFHMTYASLRESSLSLLVNCVPSSQQKGAHFISTIYADT